uniref:Uncharacterized protein n=1 Tax=Anopheles dirus TaxID=7168 RepID=A0A182NXR6_9DIPT
MIHFSSIRFFNLTSFLYFITSRNHFFQTILQRLHSVTGKNVKVLNT